MSNRQEHLKVQLSKQPDPLEMEHQQRMADAVEQRLQEWSGPQAAGSTYTASSTPVKPDGQGGATR